MKARFVHSLRNPALMLCRTLPNLSSQLTGYTDPGLRSTAPRYCSWKALLPKQTLRISYLQWPITNGLKKNKHKKFITIFGVILVTSFLFSSCGPKKTDEQNTASASTLKDKKFKTEQELRAVNDSLYAALNLCRRRWKMEKLHRNRGNHPSKSNLVIEILLY